MLISKEKAGYIAELSYKIYEFDNNLGFMTYKTASELDAKASDKIVAKLEIDYKDLKMKRDVSVYGGIIHYADDEIVEVDNYRYIDYIEYGISTYGPKKKEFISIYCKIHEGDSFEITPFIPFYGLNIYDNTLFKLDKYKEPRFLKLEYIDLYLKLLITEDRLVNPYILHGSNVKKIVVPMKEAIDNFKGYDNEINLLNKLLKICNGQIISSGIIGGFADIGIKPTILYLESIEEYQLANEVRLYQKDPLRLNLVLDRAKKGYLGLTFIGKGTKVELI